MGGWMLPRHAKTETQTVSVDVLLENYVPCLRTFGVRQPPRRWPVPLTIPLNLGLRVATCIPTILATFLCEYCPVAYSLIASSIFSSAQSWILSFLWAEFGFHLILCSAFHLTALSLRPFLLTFTLGAILWKKNICLSCLGCSRPRSKFGVSRLLSRSVLCPNTAFLDTFCTQKWK